ncbi:IS3 family transposase [Brenneria populi subsp. brevivirga]|uniref:IS3 family transposase n=1 Tax=Brenneria populi TaxID=1505588 RepID=UPI002E171564|nr:IS3 family transposase [Brenneria populi subsp. brevivirga]
MTQAKSVKKTSRNQYTPEFRQQALALAARIGVAKAARELGLHDSQLYAWRGKQRQQSTASEREQQQATEIARLKRQLAERDEELAIRQKAGHLLRQTPEVEYGFMHQHQAEFPVKTLARVLRVSRSGWYAWLKRRLAPSSRLVCRRQCDEQVAAAFRAAKKRYGAPRLTQELREGGYDGNRKTVAASLRCQGLRAKAARKFKAMTNSRHKLPVAPNLLQQDFSATGPDQKYVGDITYLWTEEGWLYLAVVIDLYSRRVVGWSMSERVKAELACDALKMALWRRKMPRGVIVHTDRGNQYCSHDYQDVIKDNGLVCSMSAKGCCYDNACAESFFHSLKVELIHGERFNTREEMKSAVFEYIEIDYNRHRRHSANGGLSPVQFEERNLA